LQSGSYLLKFEKICNPNLASKNYFVKQFPCKMSLDVSFFITSNKKWNLEGSYAFHKKQPGMTKIWRKNLLWILRAGLNSQNFPPSPNVATPAKVSTASTAKILCNIEFSSVPKKLIFKKR
jgi:hypothetical protein